MRARISAIEYYLPDLVEDNTQLAQENPDWDMTKVVEKTGIFQRHISGPLETASDLAFKAAEKLLVNFTAREEIDLLILVTQSGDYVLPTTACILQTRLGLTTSCMAFDINLGCSGFVYALSVASSLIETGVARKGLILCADTYTKYISRHDRTCRPIFSDGAAATLVEMSEAECIGAFEFGSDGKGFESLIVRNSSARRTSPDSPGWNPTLEMAGSDVLLFTMKVVPGAIRALLKKSDISLDQIDLVFFHQASKLVIDTLVRTLSLDRRKVFENYANIGNTVSATIPIALKDAEQQGLLKQDALVLLVGFGVGLSWGATLLRWSNK